MFYNFIKIKNLSNLRRIFFCEHMFLFACVCVHIREEKERNIVHACEHSFFHVNRFSPRWVKVQNHAF